MDVKHPRRILAVSAPNSGVLQVIKDLTGSSPTPHSETGSVAGLTHEWDVRTAYYKAKVPIWVDEITDVEAWETEFLKPEAREVVEAVGAWIFCFDEPLDGKVNDQIERTLQAVQSISEEHAGYGADMVFLAVAMPASQTQDEATDTNSDEWDDVCMQYGFEYIKYGAEGRNEYGEKQGFERLREALEANEWAATEDDDENVDLDDLDFDEEGGLFGFGRDEAEMTAELFGMKAALSAGDGGEDEESQAQHSTDPDQQAAQVDDLSRMLSKLLAVKEQSAELPEVQRKKMAAQAVRDIMGPLAKP